MKYLLSLLFMTLISACVDGERVNPSSTGIVNTVKKPALALELMENIKFAFDRKLFLDADFYTDDNLKLLFGAEEIQWLQKDARNMSISVHGFGKMFQPYKTKWGDSEGIDLKIGWVILADGRTMGSVSLINHSVTRMDSDALKKIFGPDYVLSRYPILAEGPNLNAPPEPKRDINYKIKDGQVTGHMYFRIGQDENLIYAFFSEEK